MIEQEKMETPQLKMSQDSIFNGIIKLINNDKILSDGKYTFYNSCTAKIDNDLKDQLQLLNNKECTLKECFNILNKYFKNSKNYHINYEDSYVGCIERVGRNSWRSYKLLDLR